MADGRIIIDTQIDSGGIDKGTKKIKKSLDNTKNEFSKTNKETLKFERQLKNLSKILGEEVPQSTVDAYKNIRKMNAEIRSTSRQFGKYSSETMKARNSLNEYVLGLDDTTFKHVYMRLQLGLTETQLSQQANSIKLNARMVKLMGSQTERLTKQMQGLKRHGIKPEDMLPASTLGQFQMLNETMKASRAPINILSAGYRKFGTSMEKTIKGWSAQKMAVKLAKGDMVRYGLLLRGISAAQMNLGLAFPIVGVAATMFYSTVFKGAIESDSKLKALSETVKNKLGKAFKPLIDVAGSVLRVILELTGKVADLMIKFNEAHPIIAKVVAAIGFLAPAMTLLLLPLSMGIGLFNGWKVAINGVWTLIGGVVSVIGTASATFLAFAGIIGALAGGFVYLWKTNEKFKNSCISAWNSISAKGKEVFGGLVKYFTETLPNAFKTGGFEGLTSTIGKSISNIANTIATKAPELINQGAQIIRNLVQGISQALPSIIQKINEVKTLIVNTIENNLPKILEMGAKIIKNLVQGITQALPAIIEKMNETRMAILGIIKNNLPKILNVGTEVITLLIQGITQALPTIIDMGIKIINSVINTITETLPSLVDAGITIITALLDGIITSLPTIIDAGIKILDSLINAIVENLPTIINCGVNIITMLLNAIAQNLPKILDAGIKILTSLVKGIIQVIPILIAAIPQIVNTLWNGLTSIDWIGLGVQIFNAIIEGLKQVGVLLLGVMLAILEPIIQPIIDFFTNLWTNIKQSFTDGWNSISTFFTETVPTFFTNLWITINQAFVDGWNAIVNFFTQTIPQWISSLAGWFNELPGRIGDALGFALGTIIKWGIDTWSYLSTNVPIWINNVVNFFATLPSRIWTWLVNTITKIVTWGRQTYTNMVNATTRAINAVIQWFSQLPGRIWTWLTNTISKIAAWGSNMVAKGRSAASNFLNSVVNYISQLPGRMWNFLSNALSKVASWGSSLFSRGVSAAGQLVTAVVSTVSKIPEKMVSIGKNIVQGVWNGITGAAGWFRSKVDDFFGGIVKGAKRALGIHSPSRVFRDQVGKYMAQGVGVGFTDETENIKKSMQKDLSSLTAKMQTSVDMETSRTSRAMTAGLNKTTNSTTETVTNNDNGLTLKVDKIINNTKQDIKDIAEELEFYRKRNSLATGGV